MASRNQFVFEGFAPPRSTLQRFIYNACDPIANLEPNLALNLEIVDLINSKKGNAPREAAVTIVQLINHRNPNVSLLALSLLDNCVKNCGYPFHLQISTKEFLNELVRRFPERPPMRQSRVQAKILEAIEEWRSTICQTSRYKEDLGFIRDMHRLLLYKGYMFPEVRSEDVAVLNPSDNLQSAEEMEEEERAAQSAKLQELIRRGRPQDLQEANRLMKVMAGYDTRHKTDYRAKAAEEVAKVQQKARILEEMLQSQHGDKIADGDVFEVLPRLNEPALKQADKVQELAGALQSAHPKIQKMCEEESDDAEAVAKLLEINDSIHRTIERYKLMKAGDIEAANKIEKGTLGTSTGVGKNAANELSLIDFDPEPPAAPPAAASSSSTNGSLLDAGPATSIAQARPKTVEDDLLGLSLDDSSAGTLGAISLGPSTSFSAPSGSIFSNAPSTLLSSQPSIPHTSPQTTPRPNYDAFASLTGSFPTSKPATPVSMAQHQQPPRPSSQVLADPFAALVSASSRPSTPLRQANMSQSESQSSASGKQGAFPPTEDDWTFESALPEPQTIKILSSSLDIDFEARRPPGQAMIQIIARFSNTTQQRITGLHFQVAVEKSYTLQLRPQSSRELAPATRHAVQQEILLNGVPAGKGSQVKMRFKVSYALDGQPQEQQGNVPPLGVS